MNDADLRGTPVFDERGEIGHVVEVTDEHDQRERGDLWIRLNGQEQPIRIARDQLREATPERVRLTISRDQLLIGNQTIRVPLHEEVLEMTTHEVERGRLRIHKMVETAPHEETVTVGRDDVSVERVPVNQIVDHALEPRQEGDTLIIPLVDEVLVVEKRLRVREELHITHRRVDEQQTVHADLRREVVDIDTSGAIDESRSI